MTSLPHHLLAVSNFCRVIPMECVYRRRNIERATEVHQVKEKPSSAREVQQQQLARQIPAVIAS